MMKPVTAWPKRVGGAALMGLAWAAMWAPVAIVVGTQIVDPDNSMDEMWFLIGAYPGFLTAIVFSIALAIAHRRLAELSLLHATALGTLSGIAVAILPFIIGAGDNHDKPLIAPAILAAFTAMGAVSAVVSASFARSRARNRGDACAVTAGHR